MKYCYQVVGEDDTLVRSEGGKAACVELREPQDTIRGLLNKLYNGRALQTRVDKCRDVVIRASIAGGQGMGKNSRQTLMLVLLTFQIAVISWHGPFRSTGPFPHTATAFAP